MELLLQLLPIVAEAHDLSGVLARALHAISNFNAHEPEVLATLIKGMTNTSLIRKQNTPVFVPHRYYLILRNVFLSSLNHFFHHKEILNKQHSRGTSSLPFCIYLMSFMLSTVPL